jgi:unsaturated rhamnogalacturonyl hydrolase
MNRWVSLVEGLCCLAVFSAFGQPASKLTPEQAARAIISRVVNETSFELQSVPLKPSLDIQAVDFGTMFGADSGGVAFALSAIRAESDTTIAFGLSRDLPLTIRLNGAIVYCALNPSSLVFHEIGYELFRFNDTVRLPLRKGFNRLLIKSGLVAGRNVVYLRELSSPGSRPSTSFDLAGVDQAVRGKPWTFIGVFKNSGAGLVAESLPPESGYKSTYVQDGAEFSWRFPAQQVVKEFRIKSDAVYRRESYAEWQYPNGTVMLSLLDFASAVHDTSVSSFVRAYCTFTLDNLELFRKQYEQLHAFRGADHKLIRRGMLDDTGAPALPFAELFLRTRDQRLQPLVADMAEYVSKGQVRLADGTLCRYEKMPGTVWADDLFMAAPYLMRMGLITGDKKYFDDAAQQVLNFNKYLQDERTGLYRHGWYELDKRQSAVSWGRANGWVVWATSEVLRFLPTSHPLREKIIKIYRHHLKSIIAFQAPSGLWHQVLDRPDSFEETSCTAMYLIGLARGVRSGILDASFVPPLTRAWSGLQTRITNDGIVKDICRGTEMSDDIGFYFKRERFDNDPRGLGAVITACVEMMNLRGENSQE